MGREMFLPQLIQAVTMRQILPILHKKLWSQENDNTMAFLEKVSDIRSNIVEE